MNYRLEVATLPSAGTGVMAAQMMDLSIIWMVLLLAVIAVVVLTPLGIVQLKRSERHYRAQV
jgi:hypothetical protein